MINPKNKGKGFELQVSKEIRKSGLDNKARRRPLSGAEKMVKGYGDLITSLPFAFELKKQEKMLFWKWWEQAESQASMSRPAVLIHSANHRKVICSMELRTFLNILKGMNEKH